MKINYFALLALVVCCVFSACKQPIEIEEEGYPKVLDPLKDDPTTVGNFKTSKFDGFWKVTNLEIEFGQPVILDHPPTMYIFKENTIQTVAGTRNNFFELIEEMNVSWPAKEFMYSNTAIYIKDYDNGSFVQHKWLKRLYELSSDETALIFGKKNYFLLDLQKDEHLEKINVEPWTKEDLIGTWYTGNLAEFWVKWTFSDDLLVTQMYYNILPFTQNNELIISYREITVLEDETVTGRLNLEGRYIEYGSQIPVSTYHYYIIDGKLILSSGDILMRYVE